MGLRGVSHIQTLVLGSGLLGVAAESAQFLSHLTALVPDPPPRCDARSWSWAGLVLGDGEPPFPQVVRGFSCVVVNPGSTVRKHLELGEWGGLEPYTLLLKDSPYSCILSSFLNYLRRVVVVKINPRVFVKDLLLLPSR